MDVVTEAGSIRSIVVGAKNRQRRNFSHRGEKGAGDEVGFGVVVFAD